jgi:putative phage-type endonuclease
MESPVIEQGSEAWQTMRCGKITASRIKMMVAKTKSGPSASRQNLAATLMLERVLGVVEETFVNDAMRRGVEEEPLARLAYTLATGNDVEEVPFINHPNIANAGASPDGLVGEDGMVEIKNPNTSTHVGWAIAGVVPAEHVMQLQWQMACSGRKWCDFVSFDSRMPEGQSLFIKRLYRDDDLIEKVEKQVVEFDAEVEKMVSDLRSITWY